MDQILKEFGTERKYSQSLPFSCLNSNSTTFNNAVIQFTLGQFDWYKHLQLEQLVSTLPIFSGSTIASQGLVFIAPIQRSNLLGELQLSIIVFSSPKICSCLDIKITNELSPSSNTITDVKTTKNIDLQFPNDYSGSISIHQSLFDDWSTSFSYN
ncbi:hypothetical protein ACTFIU_000367 [Dictyostelium citrinum]